MAAFREAVQAKNTGTTAYSCYIDLWETVLQFPPTVSTREAGLDP
jgi:hypothetical protein